MGGIFGGGESKQAEAPPPAPTPVDADAEAKKAEQARQQQARANGYSSTILTSGLADQSAPEVKKKTLLGV